MEDCIFIAYPASHASAHSPAAESVTSALVTPARQHQQNQYVTQIKQKYRVHFCAALLNIKPTLSAGIEKSRAGARQPITCFVQFVYSCRCVLRFLTHTTILQTTNHSFLSCGFSGLLGADATADSMLMHPRTDSAQDRPYTINMAFWTMVLALELTGY